MSSRLSWLALPVVLSIASPAFAAPARHGSMPDVSPDGRWIAFASDRDSAGGAWDVYVVRPDGSGLKRVTRTSQDEYMPRWSGDGREVLMMTSTDDTTMVWAARPDGTGHRRVVALAAKDIALSHDGRRILYTVGTWTKSRLWVANVDGSDAAAISDSTGSWFNLAWSPDDRRFAVTRGDSTRRLAIVVMNADGSGRRTVLQLSEADGNAQWPMWSADGKRLAVQAGRYDKDPAKSSAHIWVLDLATGAPTRLDPHGNGRLDETPAWFPDGRRLAFQSDRSGAFEIWTMRADGSDPRRVTR